MQNDNATITVQDKIVQLLDLTGLGSMPDAVVESTIKQFRDSFGLDAVEGETNITPTPELTEQLKEAFALVDVTLRSKRDDLHRSIVNVYARVFAEIEIDELIEFHASHVGRKLAELGPLIQKEILEIECKWGPDALKSIEGELTRIITPPVSEGLNV